MGHRCVSIGGLRVSTDVGCLMTENRLSANEYLWVAEYLWRFISVYECHECRYTRKKLIFKELPNSSETEDMRKIR